MKLKPALSPRALHAPSRRFGGSISRPTEPLPLLTQGKVDPSSPLKSVGYLSRLQDAITALEQKGARDDANSVRSAAIMIDGHTEAFRKLPAGAGAAR